MNQPFPDLVIDTARTRLTLGVSADGLLVQKGYGAIGGDPRAPREGDEQVRQLDFYPTYGDGYLGEPALMVTHADGDTATRLTVSGVKTAAAADGDPNVALTEIELRDPLQPLTVTLCLRAYHDEDVLQIWTRIRNGADRAVTLHRYASAAPAWRADAYHLAQCCGAYANEANIVSERLTPGRRCSAPTCSPARRGCGRRCSCSAWTPPLTVRPARSSSAACSGPAVSNSASTWIPRGIYASSAARTASAAITRWQRAKRWRRR
ncbi:MAG: hypothetical protein LBK76_05475 [Verrucomicrobiales bacterium]|jgi:hypothetical protein|nr:hypothetical protein [Verrucomicrobiales bacterium]